MDGSVDGNGTGRHRQSVAGRAVHGHAGNFGIVIAAAVFVDGNGCVAEDFVDFEYGSRTAEGADGEILVVAVHHFEPASGNVGRDRRSAFDGDDISAVCNGAAFDQNAASADRGVGIASDLALSGNIRDVDEHSVSVRTDGLALGDLERPVLGDVGGVAADGTRDLDGYSAVRGLDVFVVRSGNHPAFDNVPVGPQRHVVPGNGGARCDRKISPARQEKHVAGFSRGPDDRLERRVDERALAADRH